MPRYFSCKKILLVGLLAIAFLPQVSGLQVFAQANTIGWGGVSAGASIGGGGVCEAWNPNTWPTCFLVAISYFPGLLVALAAWMITLGLEMNSHLVDTSMVKSGFDITLAVANLGFVFAIILIALATIIDYESYGIKKNLWKLVAAALLVNFSLVICSVIIGFFDQFAYFFAARMGDYDTYGYSGLSNQLVNAFSLNKISAWTLKDAGAFLPTIIFIIIFLLIIAFTLFAIAFMLIIRYIYLAILMILMPIAWLAWVVPGMQKHWSSWWQNFIKWTLSPTIILTLLYIAIIISTNSNDQIGQWTTGSLKGGGAGTVVNTATLSSDNEGFISVILRMVVSLSLVWGAIIAANAMGAQGASTAMSWNKAIGKRAKNYGIKLGKRAGTYGLRTEQGRKATQSLQTAGNSRGAFLRTLAMPARIAGTALSGARQQGEKILGEASKPYKDMALIEQARQYGSVIDPVSKFTILKNIHKAIEGSAKELKKQEDAYTKNGTEANKKKRDKAREEHEKNQALMNLLPAKARGAIETYQDLDNLPGGVGQKVKYNNRTFGKMFVLYGEHEKQHKKSGWDEIKKMVKEEEDGDAKTGEKKNDTESKKTTDDTAPSEKSSEGKSEADHGH